MALDTGRLSEVPSLTETSGVGEALKQIRLFRGLSLEDVAHSTRIRRVYLEAIESMRLDALPSRPFTIGYVRAYAQALGVSPDTAVERFRKEHPAQDEPLRAPVGVTKGPDPRLTVILVGALVVLGAFVAWNVIQRISNAPEPKARPTVAARVVPAGQAAQSGPVALGAPLPPPMESTTPDLYETPGLAAAVPGANGLMTLDGAPVDLATAPQAAAPTGLRLAPTFVADDGAIYGAPAQSGATLVLQALKAAPLVVKSHGGAVYFARQLAKGEAYRAPPLPGVIVETADPHAFQVFVGGQSKGLLAQSHSELKSLAGATKPAKPARPGA
ncbi:helix-turn-helix domain-containing protein [Phenylobacterium immobile]|uniref:helix-turn-helix domain-containing protein n=1 Tax=Phenylobacterium immobile TaxID=21 RepID=UPI000A839612|nr:helix-turn-helix domain-containing protein [Phenylobacterium immobile]